MASTASNTEVPEGFVLHTENTSHLLLEANAAFLNPVQEFNRDLSVATIRVWSELLNQKKEEQFKRNQEKKLKKAEIHRAKRVKVADGEEVVVEPEQPEEGKHQPPPPTYSPYRFTLLEALSATGLRSIRYAKEIPLLKQVIANDLSPAAVEAMHRNVKYNGLADVVEELPDGTKKVIPGKVKINEGDACSLMYQHREEKARVDAIDLDPYGTAAPFIDGAVQAVKDGGLLCVTCTDLAVLATNNYPEKCFSNYGGVSLKAEYCHEAALRLVLHSIATSAARYGRYITPLLSLSIDFYVRVFVRVDTSPMEVKKLLTKNSTIYLCSSCQNFYEQPLGRILEKPHEKSGHVNYLFKTQQNTVAGPMWNGPLHDSEFVGKVLEHLESHTDHYGTAPRMKGMLTVAKEELESLFYFTPATVSSFFHCQTPSLDNSASALLNAGFKISRSHAAPGSLKTNATRKDVYDVFRGWIKTNPVRLDKVSENSPARALIAKEPSFIADFTKHPDSVTPSSKVKLVRYQENPTSHWGPARKATGLKRKRSGEDVAAASASTAEKP
ncbi:tRNA (guanine-N2-)-methyltransferase [Coprinopsis cinerea okayama7|uniref:tRNA (guanine(26)-N(2))-dimethyltransferase n=1 Tax=Coprinopsis cinerea (strain Okayama-7 / 130 / ATCC MYA-4618 / FGSC 9003) TaxID=240176 RepID=A8NF17_COPC7|nr:tRNA (guanine-N2-)-methyltransferase [Coprinopsis cinerea okayama7\|eukprot:XP_001833188.2 tRNA (guanine-N2-)-methyltransferase [Coprinopsis cinerea okayama7\